MSNLTLSTLLMYYKRPEIQDEIVKAAKDKETAIKFGTKGFGKRPDFIKYPRDVLELAKQGATSFHCSEELWTNPLRLSPTLKKAELDNLRKGWDLILDIDCKILEYSGIAADLLVKALKFNGIECVTVKFSGNHGYHIAVPFEAFPNKVHGHLIKDWFPEGPRKIAEYLKEMIRTHLASEILKKDNLKTVAERTEKKTSELVIDGKFDPFVFLEIDTVLISSRHLYRMPYCFNEKSGLVSIPIDPEKILEFKKETAKPENVRVSNHLFLKRDNIKPNEARQLIVQAFDFCVKKEETQIKETKEVDIPEHKIPEQYFPPCVKKILAGLEDGKKRSMFVLVNFLTSTGWDYDDIDELLKEWNKRNKEPLRDVILLGQTRYNKRMNKKILPPNCDNKSYYQSFHVCHPDALCKKIKNPVNYAKIKIKSAWKQEQWKKSKQKAQKAKKDNKSQEPKNTKDPKEN